MNERRVIVPNENTKLHSKLLDVQDGCIICGKPKAGRHYAVNSCCLGCKTFFRRAIIQNRRYFCDNNLQCNPRERKSRGPCAACRLNRCFLAGMTKCALRGRRDIIAPKRGKHTYYQESVDCKSDANKSPLNYKTSSPKVRTKFSSYLKVDTVQQLTVLDKALRERKLRRFQSLVEARKLACSILGQTNMPFLSFSGLRIVDIIELAALTSMEMYAMIEWVSTLSFYPKLSTAHRVCTIRRFAVYQIVIETGYCTAQSEYKGVWMMPNGTCMPLSIEHLPEESQKMVTPARKWRQDRLYKEMTNNCIEVGLAFRRLGILPEELAVLKIIVFCECGKNEAASSEAVKILEDFKDCLFKHLFEFYRQSKIENYEERFANLILDISGLVETASALNESFQVMRVFRIVPFDSFTERVLFSSDNSSV